MLHELIDDFYREQDESRSRNYFYATDAGKCPRAVYFSIKGYRRKDLDPRILRIFNVGDDTHRRILGALFSLGLVAACEIPLPNQKLIHGRADAILSVKGRPIVLEIKSSSSNKFRKLSRPEEAHLKQLQVYLHFFHIPQGIILYENKDNQEIKEFRVEYNSNLAKQIIKRFEDLKGNIDNDILPDVPEEYLKKRSKASRKALLPFECRYCDFGETCDLFEEKNNLKL